MTDPHQPIHLDRLNGCARCDGDGHDDITFQPLTHPLVVSMEMTGGDPLVFTHWAPCPTNGEPILMTHTVDLPDATVAVIPADGSPPRIVPATTEAIRGA